MNYVPARITWLLIALTAATIHGFSMLKALRIGWTQHAILPEKFMSTVCPCIDLWQRS